jgi:hypothetical protein
MDLSSFEFETVHSKFKEIQGNSISKNKIELPTV